jgi:hypothetical protein
MILRRAVHCDEQASQRSSIASSHVQQQQQRLTLSKLAIATSILVAMIGVHVWFRLSRSLHQEPVISSEKELTTVLTVAVLTSPRPNNDIHLLTTIHSLIDEFKHFIGYYREETLNDRFMLIRHLIERYQLNIVVVNHFGEIHKQFFALEQVFEDFIVHDSNGHLKNIDINPLSYIIQIHLIDEKNVKMDIEDNVFLLQRAHASSLLKHALKKHKEKLSRARFFKNQVNDFIMLLEDDFPACSNEDLSRAFAIPVASNSNAISLVYNSLDKISNKMRLGAPFCGLFVATGGSGLIFSQLSIEYVINALDQKEEELLKLVDDRYLPLPHDIIIQRCLSGGRGAQTEEEKRVYKRFCSECAPNGSLYTSGKLWFKHTGYYSSTIFDRTHKLKKWKCGTKQPFSSKRYVINIEYT